MRIVSPMPSRRRSPRARVLLTRGGNQGTRFGYTQVKGVIALLREQPVGLAADLHIGGFQGDNRVAEVQLLQDIQLFSRRFHHGGRPVLRPPQLLGQGALVGAHTQGDTPVGGLADNFLGFPALPDIPRIDAYLDQGVIHALQSNAVIEVNVRHQGHCGLFRQTAQLLRRRHVRRGETDKAAAHGGHFLQCFPLLFKIGGEGFIPHGLYDDRIIPAQLQGANGHGSAVSVHTSGLYHYPGQ